MPAKQADSIYQTISTHEFHPLNKEGTFTIDKELGKHGIADLKDPDWRVRTLALRDLIRIGMDDGRCGRCGLRHRPDGFRRAC